MESSVENSSAPRREPLLLAGWALILFAITIALHGRHNDFPYFYHPDEGEKVHQVMSGEWNFHHPMLLLTVTKAAVETMGIAKSEQSVVEAGRWISAAFTATAVVAFALLGYMWRGWIASLVSGMALMLHHQLFELAHYMKEDSALLMGMALTFLTAFAFFRKPNAGRAALLGMAVALAISGKYIGFAALGVAVPVLWRAKMENPGRKWAWFVAALGGAFVVANLPLLLDPSGFQQSFERELGLVVHGQGGATRSVPHAQYWNIFRDNSTPVIWAMLLVFLAARWRERAALGIHEWLVIGFPFAYALALSCSPKSHDRYFLPAAATFTFLAAMGTVDAARLLSRRIPEAGALAACSVALILSQVMSAPAPADWRTFGGYFAAFQRDDNAEFVAWIRAELPADAVIAKDSRIKLPDPKNEKDAERYSPMPQTILAKKFAADIGTVAELRARGVSHVAVSESDYGKFFLNSLRPHPSEADDFARRKAFYEELFRSGAPIFQRSRDTVLYLHPGIQLYQLSPPPN